MHHWHHTFYKSRHMEYDEINDIYMLFMPPWLQLFYFLIYIPLLSMLLSLILPRFVVMHFIFSLTLYYACYELMHWLEHLPHTHPLMKIKLIEYMRRHHMVHHSTLKDI
jgi:cellulose synthase/poly-beta-1,6-N-acetylglucosamine synthase-like glycosyltransferase